jgi:hypothetical protein
MESDVTRSPNPADGISAADCSELAGVRLLDVVRYAVTEVAPEELPLVIGLSRFDDGQITRMLARRHHAGATDRAVCRTGRYHATC